MDFSVVTTVISAAASYNLTDLATAKTELSISGTAQDSWLTQAITQVSRAIAAYTKRVLVPEAVQDVFDFQVRPWGSHVRGVLTLQLTRWPVLAVTSIVQTLLDGTTQTLIEGTDFRVDYNTGDLLRLDTNGLVTRWEIYPLTVVYAAGYGSMVTEAHAVPATPYQVTVSQSTAFSFDQSVEYANGTALTRVSGTPSVGQYSVAAGVYTFAAADQGQSLTFTYGVKSIPDDLVEVCLRLITARFRALGRDPALVQQETPGIGIQRFWFGSAPGQKGPFAPDVEATLEPYCIPALG